MLIKIKITNLLICSIICEPLKNGLIEFPSNCFVGSWQFELLRGPHFVAEYKLYCYCTVGVAVQMDKPLKFVEYEVGLSIGRLVNSRGILLNAAHEVGYCFAGLQI
jgi:hypothetical protein